MSPSECQVALLAASLKGCSWAPILRAEQAAMLLGCSKEHIEVLAARGELPAVKFGRGWIFTVAQLLQHVSVLAAANLRSGAIACNGRKEADGDAGPLESDPQTSEHLKRPLKVQSVSRPTGRPRRAIKVFSDIG
jgi:excisionase family DNA binding protein